MKQLDFNKIYETKKYGTYNIIYDYGYELNKAHRYVRIRFNYTGYEMDVREDAIGHHDFRDPYYPSIYGVACSGGVMNIRTFNKNHYDRWMNMISRCYNPNDKDYKRYGALGVRVSNDWLCFEVYLYDIQKLPGYDKFLLDPYNYTLDKDYLQINKPLSERIYSKETCIWLHRSENSAVRTMDNKKMVNAYHGVYKNRDFYYSTIDYEKQRFNIGKFEDPIIAANAYNHFANIIHSRTGKYYATNNVPYISPCECIKHNLTAKIMATKVDK